MQKKYSYKVVLIFIVVYSFSLRELLAQMKNDKLQDKLSKADELFDHVNYLMAIQIYKELLKKEPDNKYVKAKLAVCYLNTNQNRSEPIKLLEELTKEEKTDIENWYYLGMAYHLNGQIDKAIETFEKYISLKPKNRILKKPIEKYNNVKTLRN